MRRIIHVLLLCFISNSLFGMGDTTRVLFIGNSLTYTDSVPRLVKGLADAAGYQLRYFAYTPPGATVGDTSQGTYAHMFNPEVFDAIRADDWDFVCLQDNQGRFILGNGRFPDPVAFKIIEGHFKIMDSVHYYHPCTRMVWFAGWAFKNGYPGLSTTGKGLIDNIYQNYVYLKDTAGEIISPIGIAWERAMVALPKTDLWASDETHESLSGAYLTASVIFSSVFRKDVTVSSFNGGLDSATAKTLRQIAYQTFIDSGAANNVDRYSPTLTIEGTTLHASAGYATYYWYLNGTLVNTSTDNALNLSTPGCYQVLAEDGGGCRARSVERCVGSLGVSRVVEKDDIKVYPVPASEVMNLEWAAMESGVNTVTLASMEGRIATRYETIGVKTTINTRGMAPGMYLLTISGGGMTRHKIVELR